MKHERLIASLPLVSWFFVMLIGGALLFAAIAGGIVAAFRL
jgi:hypothetical protein